MSEIRGVRGIALRPAFGLRHGLRQRITFYAPLGLNLTSGVGVGSTTATFTRATTATYKNSSSQIASAASGVARYETNGLLIEGARTNLILRSEDLSNASWTAWQGTVATDVASPKSPDTTQTAERFKDNGTSNSHGIFQSYTGTASAKEVMAIFFNKYGLTNVIIDQYDGTYEVDQWFNVDTPSVGTFAQYGGGSNWTQDSATVEKFTGTWVRCTVVMNAPAGTSRRMGPFSASADATLVYVGDSASGYYAWGCQAETNVAFASSYIPTAGATVTRNQDILTFPASGNLPVTGPGSVLMDVDVNNAAVAMTFLDTRNSSNQQGITMGMNASGQATADMFTTTSQAAMTATADTFTAGTRKRIGMAFDTDDCQLVTSGASRATDTSATLPSSHTAITLGSTGSNGTPLFGHVKELVVFAERLSGLDLIMATSVVR